MRPYVGSIFEALEKADKAHDKAYASISPEFKKKIKIAEAKIEKAEAEYDQIKEEAETSMAPKLREECYKEGKKCEKVLRDMGVLPSKD